MLLQRPVSSATVPAHQEQIAVQPLSRTAELRHSEAVTRSISVAIAAAPLAIVLVGAQDRLKSIPGYERAQRFARDAGLGVRGGALAVSWSDDSRAFEFTRDGKRYRFDIESRAVSAAPSDTPAHAGGAPVPERGRQLQRAVSPDGSLAATYRDRNVWLGGADGANERAVTTDGSAGSRVKYGSASWVYGEELSQRTAMWWSPDSRRLAYYRFDEHDVRDYFVVANQLQMQPTLDAEAYPNAGTPNPVVDLFVYDVASKQSVRVEVRDGRPFDDGVVGHYVYRVAWTADGSELTFLRMNRRQNVMELAAANPATGGVRVILREEWPTGWLMSEPRLVFLRDGRRFIWESQRNGWDNFYLYDLSGRLIAPLTTSAAYEAAALVKIDERANALFYTARDGDNPLKLQLHRVGLDGTGDRRLTDPAFHHTIAGCIPSLGSRPEATQVPGPCPISPDSRYFADIYQTHDTPAATRLADAESGRAIAELAHSDTSRFDDLGLRRAELFTFTAADGRTTLRGLLQFPSTFDPSKRYPLLVSVYGGPEFASLTARETFVTPSPMTEYGFLLATLESRAVPGLGKRTLDAIYETLGQTDIDDMATGVRSLWSRPYLDRARAGIFGTSYGGYAAAMGLLRHPDVFAAGAISSPPTDWRNYDTIYTERYMWMPGENAAGYDAGSVLKYAKDLKGRLLIYYGSADNNVHPSNSLQLIKALQDAGKSHEVQVGPDAGHSSVNQDRMLEFFVDALKPAP
jgi:dipeptidyl-peptidase-4